MGFFSRKLPLPTPGITVNGLEIQCSQPDGYWSFSYRGTDFHASNRSFVLPSTTDLDSILASIEALMPEMRSRLVKGLEGWGDARLDSGESLSVELSDFATDRSYCVTWSDGEGWGDMAADFTIRDGTIVDEGWGD